MRTYAGYKPKVEVVDDRESLSHKSVDYFVNSAKKAITSKGRFFVAISGGYTPKRFFELLGSLPQAVSLQWDKVELFWVDERIVSPESQQSNYKLARDTFLTKVSIPAANVHRIPTEDNDFGVSARKYEETIRDVFNLNDKELPKFDLIMLGMGDDGHTGSMFPDSYASFDTSDIACVVYVMDEKLNRITLTHPVLCAAEHLVVLVSGSEKTKILKEVFTTEPDEVRYPIHRLWGILEKITWLVDKDAAELL